MGKPEQRKNVRCSQKKTFPFLEGKFSLVSEGITNSTFFQSIRHHHKKTKFSIILEYQRRSLFFWLSKQYNNPSWSLLCRKIKVLPKHQNLGSSELFKDLILSRFPFLNSSPIFQFSHFLLLRQINSLCNMTFILTSQKLCPLSHWKSQSHI